MGESILIVPKKWHREPSISHKVLAFFDKLATNDETPGLHIEPVKNSADPRARTGRVDDFYRALLFKLEGRLPSYVLHGIYPHDEAYEQASKVTLTVNPINGLPSFAHVTPTPSREPYAPAPVLAGRTPLLPFTATDLTVCLGIPPEVAEEAARISSPDALREFAERLPESQGLALLLLGDGEPLSTVTEELRLMVTPMPDPLDAEAAFTAEPATDQALLDAFKTPSGKMDFATIEGAEALRQAIQSDFAAWQVFLHPQQQHWVEKDFNGAVRLAGGAGTGKTVVVVHRAARLTRQGLPVVVTTFTKNLAAELERSLQRLAPELSKSQRLGEPGLLVSGVDALASQVLRAAGSAVAEAVQEVLGVGREDIHGRTRSSAWQSALDVAGERLEPRLRRPSFMETEYQTVILPSRITTEAEYLRAPRRGRGVRLARAARKAVWAVVEAYRAQARSEATVDFGEAAAIAAAWLRAHPLSGVRVLVDEGQDFRPSHWQLVRALAPVGSNDIFIAEDAHQRIYSTKVVLSHLGIETRGRSRKLRLNYRTTEQTLRWAVEVLHGHSVVDSDGETESIEGYVSARSGPTPQVRRYGGLSEELDAAAQTLRGWTAESKEPGAIGVLVRDRASRDRVVAGLDERGVHVRALDTGAHAGDHPMVLTMHRAKGMEFAKVLIFGVSRNSIPMGLQEYDYDQAEYDEAMLRERSLLYVAATRARDELVISYSGERSELLLCVTAD